MRASLSGYTLSLQSDDAPLRDGWRLLFDLDSAAAAAGPGSSDMVITGRVVDKLPPLPAAAPSYRDPVRAPNGRSVTYFDTANGGMLSLARPAQIRFDFAASAAHLTLTPLILDTGNLEDVTMLALAPLLRRRAVYMAHAFAVARERAILIGGPSGSGKTTTGLALIQAGWRYLANDVTLLTRRNKKIVALPSPGAVNIDPASLDLLTTLKSRPITGWPRTPAGKIVLPHRALLASHEIGQPAPVAAILFPSLTSAASFTISQLPRAIGLASLIEESVDQWDTSAQKAHIDFLVQLSQQVDFLSLAVPRGRSNLEALAGVLSTSLGAQN